MNLPERFVSEAIQPVVATYDTARMAMGEPGLPRDFVQITRSISTTGKQENDCLPS